MTDSAIHQLSLTELAAKLSKKELSAVDIVTAIAARQNAVEPQVHAFTERFEERALEEARSLDALRARGDAMPPLSGLPVSVKENIAISGKDVTLGVRARIGQAAGEDAVVVKLLRRAGAIMVGRTNLSQTLLFHESDNAVYGRTNNPWNLARTPGGSSGGEAAAIAAGMSAGGIGTDIGGSVRVPAAFSGIFGLKPTTDRWSNVGCTSALAGQELIRAQCGPLARTAGDLAFLFKSLDSPQHTAFDPQVPPLPSLDWKRTEPKTLRIGVFDDDRFFMPAASVQRAVRVARDTLEKLGATVVPFEVPNAVDLVYLYFAALSSDGGRTLKRVLAGETVLPQLRPLKLITSLPGFLRAGAAAYVGSQGEQRIERLLTVLHERRIADYWPLAHRRTQLRLEMVRAFDALRLDAVICPAHPTPALRHGQSKDFSLAGCYSMYWNLVNFPAGVMPVTRVRADETERPAPRDRLDRTAQEVEKDSTGLPVGVQIVARPWREDMIFAVMIALEKALADGPDYPRTPVDPSGDAQ